ncbi:MAG: hypothetical protein ACYCVE_05160, partial [Gemmatimonadaceae bacterium]
RWIPFNFEQWLPRGRISWLEASGCRFEDVFFDHTVRTLRESQPRPQEWASSTRVIDQLAARCTLRPPRGLIFHVSRCGSSLLAAALRTAGHTEVIAEPRPLNILLTPDAWQWQDGLPGSERGRCLTTFAHLYGCAVDYAEGIVLKFCSWNILSWRIVRAAWPDIPCVVVIRDPLEVLASNVAKMPDWVVHRAVPVAQTDTFGWPGYAARVLSTDEYVGRVLARYFEAAAELAQSGATLISYEDMTTSSIQNVARLFGTTASFDAITAVMARNTKDPRAAPWNADADKWKRAEASARQMTVVDRTARPSYELACSTAGLRAG